MSDLTVVQDRNLAARPPLEWKKYQDSKQAVANLPHKNYDRAQLIIFAGKREMGKTFALKKYMDTRDPRVFVLDPFEDFGNITARKSIEEAMLDMVRAGEAPCLRRVVPPIGEDSFGFADKFFNLAIHNLRDCLIVLDEMSMWSGMHETSNFRKLILQGRRMRIRMAIATQRISLLPGAALSEATEMMFFRLRRPRDLVVVREWSNAKVAEEVAMLGQGECVLGTSL